jgi:hypothetical protein
MVKKIGNTQMKHVGNYGWVMLINVLNILTTILLTSSAVGKWKQIFRCQSVALKILGRQTDAKVRVGGKLDYKIEISRQNCTKTVP